MTQTEEQQAADAQYRVDSARIVKLEADLAVSQDALRRATDDAAAGHDRERALSAEKAALIAALEAMYEADQAHWPLATADRVREQARAALARLKE